MNTIDLALALDVARRAAAAADVASLPHFEQGIQIERKADRSPVTAADRAAEQAILTVITDTFPDHRILAEESGAKSGDPRYRWIIDPIDGTKGFTRGGKFWGSLIALEVEGTVAVGTLSLPALGETYFAARGRGCFCNDAPMKLRPATSTIADATLSVGDMRPLFGALWGPPVLALIEEAE
ncbi:MAG: inositol monophosphatase family protein, partial [Myxococcota bacterium]